MNAFHLEVRVFHELVLETQVYHKSKRSIPLGDKEQTTEETSYRGISTIAPLVRRFSTSESMRSAFTWLGLVTGMVNLTGLQRSGIL